MCRNKTTDLQEIIDSICLFLTEDEDVPRQRQIREWKGFAGKDANEKQFA